MRDEFVKLSECCTVSEEIDGVIIVILIESKLIELSGEFYRYLCNMIYGKHWLFAFGIRGEESVECYWNPKNRTWVFEFKMR